MFDFVDEKWAFSITEQTRTLAYAKQAQNSYCSVLVLGIYIKVQYGFHSRPVSAFLFRGLCCRQPSYFSLHLSTNSTQQYLPLRLFFHLLSSNNSNLFYYNMLKNEQKQHVYFLIFFTAINCSTRFACTIYSHFGINI